jgi:hypothetical protein
MLPRNIDLYDKNTGQLPSSGGMLRRALNASTTQKSTHNLRSGRGGEKVLPDFDDCGGTP